MLLLHFLQSIQMKKSLMIITNNPKILPQDQIYHLQEQINKSNHYYNKNINQVF